MKNKYNYSPADFIMLRSNLLPYNDSYNTIIQSKVFDEAIKLSSPNLYMSFNKNKKLTDKEKRHLNLSISKYAKRITNRPTPFGLFSSIAFGSVGEKENLNYLHNCKKVKGVTPDFKWFLEILRKYESNIGSSNSNIKLQINNLVYHVGNVYILDEKSKYGKNSFKKIDNRFMLNDSKLLNMILCIASKPIGFVDLLDKIQNNLKKYTREQLKAYIQKLIDNEFLVSDLRPIVYDNEILSRLIRKAKYYDFMNDLTLKLEKISDLINSFINIDICKDNKTYSEILSRMSSLFSVKEPLRVDMKTEYNNIPTISSDNAHRAVNSVEQLLKICPKNSNYPWLNKYLNKFIERYGLEQIVPVNKVLDQTFGIGYPDGYLRRKNIVKKDEMPVSHSYILDDIWMKKVLHGIHTINLSDEDFSRMSNIKTSKKSLPTSGEVYFSLLKSKNSNRKDKIILSNMIGSLSAGNTFGRFWYLLKSEEQKVIKNFQNSENYNTDYIRVEVSEIPSFGENGNVMNNKSNLHMHMRLRTVNFNDNNEIDPSDVYVGATLDSLYLYSKKFNKKLYFTANNMLNFKYCSRLYRFLFEVSLMNVQSLSPISLDDEHVYMPRIEWNDVILRLSAWNLSKKNVFTKNKLNKDSFSLFCKNYFVPRYVLLTSGDNRLNLDLCNKNDISILEQEMRKNNFVLITEDFLRNNDELYRLPLQVDNKKFSSEIVLPFKINLQKNYSGNNIAPLVSKPELDYYSQFFNEKWFYVDINIDFSRENQILKILSMFVKQLETGNKFEWFYINYKNDSGNTIRYRIRYDNVKNSLEDIYIKFYDIFKLLYDYGLASDFTIKRYIPETYRYGGENLISDVEKFFNIDSEICVYLLNNFDKSDLLYFNGLFDYYIMKYMGLSLRQMENNTSSLVNNDIKKSIHSLSKKVVYFYKNKDNILKHKPDISNLICNWIDSLKMIKEKINNENLTEQRNIRIINSLMHMHSNRVNGINILKEGQVLYLSNSLVRYIIHHG